MVVATAVSLITIFGALFGLVVFHAVLMQSQAQLDRLDQDLRAEQVRAERLELQILELESPDRVVPVATEDLGLQPADQVVAVVEEPVPAEQPSGAAPPGPALGPPDGLELADPAGAGGPGGSP